VKLAAALGFTTGLELLPVFLETALVSGAMAGIIYGVATKKGLRSMMPFGPFLILAMVVTLTFGQEMLLYYMSLF
jgi:leader peptidase (prepilin peptidase) / N-methyltransferase